MLANLRSKRLKRLTRVNIVFGQVRKINLSRHSSSQSITSHSQRDKSFKNSERDQRMVRSLKPPIRSTLQNLCQDSPIQTKNFSWIFLDIFLIQRGNALHFVAIDGVSKYTSALINRNSGNESFIKFLYGYIDQNCILSNFGTDQYSGFKNAKIAFCKS